MANIHTIQKENHHTMLLPSIEKDVVRFKITFDVYTKQLKDHPSLAEQYTELLLSGTKKHSRAELLFILESLGTELSVTYSGTTHITISVITLRRNLKNTLSLIHEILTESTFARRELDRVKKQLAQELHEEKDDAKIQAYTIFSGALFKKQHQNYVAPAKERLRDLEKTDRTDLTTFHKTVLTGTWRVSISADPTSSETVQRVLNGIHKPRATETPRASTPAIADAFTRYVPLPSKSNVDLCIGNVLPYTRADDAYLPFTFGLSVLAKAGGFAGRLMSIVREREGLTYMIYGRMSGITTDAHGCWYIQTFFTPKDLETGIASTKREIQRIIDKGVTNKEMEQFRALLHNQFLIAHESSARMLDLYHGTLLTGKSAKELNSEYERLDTLTKREVNEALRSAIDPKKLVIAGAGPVDNT